MPFYATLILTMMQRRSDRTWICRKKKFYCGDIIIRYAHHVVFQGELLLRMTSRFYWKHCSSGSLRIREAGERRWSSNPHVVGESARPEAERNSVVRSAPGASPRTTPPAERWFARQPSPPGRAS